MSGKIHKPYPAEFKSSTVTLAIESKQISKELGIKANTLYTWVDKYSQAK